jgi:hypothetical protein
MISLIINYQAGYTGREEPVEERVKQRNRPIKLSSKLLINLICS